MTAAPKWIVTGGAGFIGANVTRALADEGVYVVIVDDLSRASAPLNLDWLTEEVPSAFTFARIDVRDRTALEGILREHRDAEVVLHLAGQVAVTTSTADPRADFEANAVGTFNVLEAVRTELPEAVFLNASTNKVYGDLGRHRIEEFETRYVDADYPGGVPESLPLDPHSPYGCSKAAADSYTLDYARTYGLRAVSLRQSCIYGPRQFGVEDQGWVAWFAIAARLGRAVTIFGNGKQVRDLLHVDDLVRLYRRAAEEADRCAGRAYNVGGGPRSTLSLLELLALLESRNGAATETSFAPARPGDQRAFVCDLSAVQRDLGWEPQISLEHGIETLLQWVEAHAHVAESMLAAA